MGSVLKRIDKSLDKMISKKQNELKVKTGLSEISYPLASKSLANDIIKLKTNRRFTQKERRLLDL